MQQYSNIEILTEKVLEILTRGKSPLEKWLDLKKRNVAELYIFHIVYGWLFIKENKIIGMSNENTKYYFFYSFLTIQKTEPGIEINDFYAIFTDRFERFGVELSIVRKNQLSFPNYFYSRICQYPLLNNEFNTTFKHEIWGEIELSDMFAHQINYLEDNLKRSL